MATTSSSTETSAAQPILERPVPHIISHAIRGPHEGWTSWFTTTDHKKIGIMYLYTVLVFFVLGGVEALLIRLQLGAPENTLVTPEVYNQLFTMHGTIMLLLFATPLFFGFGNAIMPLQIGSPDVAFPRLNMLSYWLFLFGGLIAASGFLTPQGAADFGWFAYTPLSDAIRSPGVGGDLWVMGLWMAGLGTILGAVNFITTTIQLRAKGLTFLRFPFFVWTQLVTAFLLLLAFPLVLSVVVLRLGVRAYRARGGWRRHGVLLAVVALALVLFFVVDEGLGALVMGLGLGVTWWIQLSAEHQA